MYNICLYFLMFYFYSIFGWILECISCSIEQKRIVHNRGFLIGPYCPIYGFGAMYMYFFLTRYYNEPITLFVMAFVGTSLIEYITSYVMEKIFKARWWDYSNMRFNLEGRVCLKNSILFGLLGLLFVYILNPTFLDVIEKIPNLILIIISVILFITFIIDNIITYSIMTNLKNKLTNIKKDSTEEIDNQVKEILSKNTYYVKKLFTAFPRVKFLFPIGEQVLTSIRKTLDNVDKLRKERRKKIKQLKKEFKESTK